MSGENTLITINATEFFSRPTYLYALGDVKLSRPISLKYVSYLGLFVGVWTLPIYLIFGLQITPLYLAFIFIPPFILSNLAVKPIFGGKVMLDFASTVMDFTSEPKGWLDGKESNMREETFEIVNEIWVGRRRELQILADLVEGRAIVNDEDAELTDENLVRIPERV